MLRKFTKQTDYRLILLGLSLFGLSYAFIRFDGSFIGAVWAAFMFLFAGYPMALFWMRYQANLRIEINDSDPRLQIMQVYARMPAETMAMIATSRIVSDLVLGGRGGETRTIYNRGAAHVYDIAEVRAVWALADREYMTAIRRFGGDSRLQQCCTDLSEYFRMAMILTEPVGNQPARWINTVNPDGSTRFGYDVAEAELKL